MSDHNVKTTEPKFQNKNTGTRYVWVDLTTAAYGLVQVCTEAGSEYLVRYENIEEMNDA